MKKKTKTKSKWPIKMTPGFKEHLKAMEPKSVPFFNNKGDRINIPETHTIKDLLDMGVKEIRIERKGSFLPDGWYTDEKRKR